MNSGALTRFGLLPLAELTPEAFWNRVRSLLGGALTLALLLLLWTSWAAPAYLIAFPLLLAGGTAAFFLFRNPYLNLMAVLAGYIAITGYETGFQIHELLYGLYTIAFLAAWFVREVLLRRDTILRTGSDWALALFLAYAVASLGIALVHGAGFRLIAADYTPYFALTLYFPIRQAALRKESAPAVLLAGIGLIALFVAFRNLFLYRQILSSAEHLWQIAQGRIVLNEIFLMMSAIGALTLFLYAKRPWVRAGCLGCFVLFTGGVIIGQSRALWVSLALGLGVIFLLTDRRRKVKLATLALLSFTALFAVAALLFREFFDLILVGLTQRFTSLGSAATRDLSLINRFLEWRAVWDAIQQNPIVGYGPGVTFSFYDLVYQNTRVSTMIHNGYLALLYRHGIVGLGLFLFFWARSAWSGFRLFRMRTAPPMARAAGLIAVACLTAEALNANTQSPLMTSDALLLIGFMCAIAVGLHDRHSTLAALPASASSNSQD